MTLYDVLGAPADASHEELRRAFVRRARRYHPDYFVGADEPTRRQAEAHMRQLNEAWAVLGDEQRRRAYDLAISQRRPTGTRAPAPAGHEGASPWRRADRVDEPTPRDWRSYASPGAGVDRSLGVRLATMAPIALVALGALLIGAGLLFGSAGAIVIAAFFAILAAVGFVIAPMLAMTESSRRRHRRRRHRPARRSPP